MGALDDIRKDFDTDSSGDLDDIRNDFTRSKNVEANASGVPIPGSDTPADYERTRQFQAEQKPLAQARKFISDLPSEYGANVAKEFKAAQSQVGSGLEDITSNKPASGLGKIAFGIAGTAASPLTAIQDVGSDIVTKATGNPEAGSRASILPIGGLPIAKGAQTIKAAMPTNKAMNILINSIGEENLPEAVKRLESNPRLTVMDVSNPTLQRAQKLTVEPGPQQNLLEKFTTGQKDTAKSTVENIYSELGQPVNVKEKLDELKANAKKVGAEQINPAIANAKPVDLTPVLSYLDNKIKPGVNSVISAGEALPSTAIQNRLGEIKSYLSNDKSVMTDPQRLHNIQSALRVEAEGLLGSAVGSERTQGREIMGVRNQIIDAIDSASGGKYRPALSNFRDENQIEDAFQKGADITSNRKGKNEDLPEFWDDWINKAKPGEIEAAKEGALTELRRQRATVRGSLKAQTVPEIEYNKDKLSLLFGKEKAEKMANELRDERDIAVRNNKLYNDSQTAMRLKADEDINVRKPHPNPMALLPAALVEGAGTLYTGQPGLGVAAYAGSKGLMYAVNKLRNNLDVNKNVELTKLMTATGEERQKMLQIFKDRITQNQSPKGNLASNINALARVIAP